MNPVAATVADPPAAAGPGRRCAGPLPAALAALLLAACVGPPAAVQAQAPPAASAAAPAAAAARLLLRGAVPPGDRFAAYRLDDAELCKDPRLLTAGAAQQTPEPAALPAGQLTTLDFAVLRNGQPSCTVRWSFTPLAGRTYLLQGLVLGSGCNARLLDASQPDRPRPVADAVQRNRPGQPCLPIALARASAATSASVQGGQQDGEAVLNPRATTQGLEALIRP